MPNNIVRLVHQSRRTNEHAQFAFEEAEKSVFYREVLETRAILIFIILFNILISILITSYPTVKSLDSVFTAALLISSTLALWVLGYDFDEGFLTTKRYNLAAKVAVATMHLSNTEDLLASLEEAETDSEKSLKESKRIWSERRIELSNEIVNLLKSKPSFKEKVHDWLFAASILLTFASLVSQAARSTLIAFGLL